MKGKRQRSIEIDKRSIHFFLGQVRRLLWKHANLGRINQWKSANFDVLVIIVSESNLFNVRRNKTAHRKDR